MPRLQAVHDAFWSIMNATRLLLFFVSGSFMSDLAALSFARIAFTLYARSFSQGRLMSSWYRSLPAFRWPPRTHAIIVLTLVVAALCGEHCVFDRMLFCACYN
jgi:hypothetical protein